MKTGDYKKVIAVHTEGNGKDGLRDFVTPEEFIVNGSAGSEDRRATILAAWMSEQTTFILVDHVRLATFTIESRVAQWTKDDVSVNSKVQYSLSFILLIDFTNYSSVSIGWAFSKASTHLAPTGY
jgi:hypothetical protein